MENLFIDFKSPESVFNYTSSGEINDIFYAKKYQTNSTVTEILMFIMFQVHRIIILSDITVKSRPDSAVYQAEVFSLDSKR